MQIIHEVSSRVIDVDPQHAEMLKSQGWKDYQEPTEAKEEEAAPVIRKAGRPRKQ